MGYFNVPMDDISSWNFDLMGYYDLTFKKYGMQMKLTRDVNDI